MKSKIKFIKKQTTLLMVAAFLICTTFISSDFYVFAQTPIALQPQFSDYSDINPYKSLGNPLHIDIFAPDPSAHVWSDGRLYIYPSRDTPGKNFDYMESWHVLSTENLVDWTDHGRIFHVKDIPWASSKAWAPDCAYKDGTYYFYFPCNDTLNQSWVGVATSKSPVGPFTNPTKLVNGVDPNVFQDYDGNYWFVMNNSIQKLSDNMTSLEGKKYNWGEFTLGFPNYEGLAHEGSWIFKRNGIYYYMCASSAPIPRTDQNTQKHVLIYGMNTIPTGPYVYKGIVMNTIGNPYNSYDMGNNHGSIVEYKGKWLLFYHKKWKAPDGNVNRATCVDYLYFNEDGTIKEVIPTNKGVDFRTMSLKNKKNIADDLLKVYPVPADSKLHFNLPNETKNVSCTIIDLAGKIQLKQSSDIFSGNQFVDVSGLTRGYYMLQVKFDELIRTVPFLKN